MIDLSGVFNISLYEDKSILPFNDLFGNLNRNESISLSVSLLTFISGLFSNDDLVPEWGRIFIFLFAISITFDFVTCVLFDFYIHILKFLRLSLELDKVQIKEKEINFVLVVLLFDKIFELFESSFGENSSDDPA